MAVSPRYHKIEKLDLDSVPPTRLGVDSGDVVLTSAVPSKAVWPDNSDIATARPSYRRLAGIHSKSLDLEKGHRVEVFVRVR